VIAPETVKVIPELMASVLPTVPVLRNVTEEHAASAVTVTVMPSLMVTVSPATGTAEPPHVAVAFQAPVTEAVLAAALAVDGAKSAAIKVRSERAVSFFIKVTGVFWSSGWGLNG
jgi:microcystin-dependent protein